MSEKILDAAKRYRETALAYDLAVKKEEDARMAWERSRSQSSIAQRRMQGAQAALVNVAGGDDDAAQT